MIYLIKSGDYLKIGYSQYPEKRIYELQIGNPEKLKILSYKEETKPTDELPKMVYKNKSMK